MWLWLSRRFRLWLLLAVGAPLAGWALGKVADTIEARGGETPTSRRLRGIREWLRQHGRGPGARSRGLRG